MKPSFLQGLKDSGMVETPAVETISPTTPHATFEPGQNDHPDSYFLNALADECSVVSSTSTCRNDQLNTSALKLGSLITQSRGLLTEAIITEHLTDAARQASTLGDHPLTETEIAATIRSGMGAGIGKPRTIPELPTDVTETTLNGHTPTNGAMPEQSEAEKRDLHLVAVKRRAYDFRVNEEAQALWTVQRADLLGQQPPPLVSLVDLLAQPDPEILHRVKGLLPLGGRALLAAQYKAGKTSLVANLLRSLVDGDPFLGCFETDPVEKVVLIDTELDQDMLRKWLRDQNIRKRECVDTLSLRGRLATFGITNDRIRADWAKRLAGAHFIILDCLRPCLDAHGLSEDKDAGIFLTAFDALCKEAGAGEALMVHHMGHSEERSRGDSRLLDWPDAVWKIVRDTDEDGNNIESGDRFFSAVGRDVNVPESQLDWEPITRALTICGGNRTDKKARGAADFVKEIMCADDAREGLTHNQLTARLKGYGVGRNVARKAIQQAVDNMVLFTATGPRHARIHTLNPSHRGGN